MLVMWLVAVRYAAKSNSCNLNKGEVYVFVFVLFVLSWFSSDVKCGVYAKLSTTLLCVVRIYLLKLCDVIRHVLHMCSIQCIVLPCWFIMHDEYTKRHSSMHKTSSLRAGKELGIVVAQLSMCHT